MGRDATKAAGNPWYQARKKAAEYDDRLCSRESAAEQLGMSVSSLADAELGNTKFMPVDKAVLMADRYNAPWLLNHYCLNECPIGCRHSLSDEVVGIDRVTVKLLKSLKTEQLGEVKDTLLDIAADGKITEDEKPALQEVLTYTIEGNTSNKCARRSYALNSAKIVGYGRPKYDGAGTTTPVTPTKPSAGGQTSGADYKIGDIVQFNGKTHYVSSQAMNGVPCKPGKAKVTSIAKGAKHPYHLVNQGGGCTVYGWVNAADIGADSGAEQAVYTVVAGDSLWGIAQKRLGNGNRYKEIMTLNGLSSTVIRPGQKLKLPS